jgi:hypothetical protein
VLREEVNGVSLGKRKREESVEENSVKAESESDTSESESEETSEEEEESEEESSSEEEEPEPPNLAKWKKKVSSDVSLPSPSETSESSSESSTSESSASKLLPPKLLIPPGQGTDRTHLRNRRKTKTKRLKRLIAEDRLPEGSNFASLHAHDEAEETEYTEFVQPQPTMKVDVAAARRFITAGLLGNEKFDREREEARVRGLGKVEERASNTVGVTEFVPRKVQVKKKVQTEEGPVVEKIPSPVEEVPPPTEVAMDEIDAENEPDELISGFYNQVKLATQHRQTKPVTVNGTLPTPPPAVTKPLIRAFECEPEWSGLLDPSATEIHAIEIPPPELPFIDTYTARKQRPPLPPGELSEQEILKLPRMKKPREGGVMYFKSIFLDEGRGEPVFGWRSGRIEGVEGGEVRLRVMGPKGDKEEGEVEVEEGEVQEDGKEERVVWKSLLDVRFVKGE